MSLGQEMFFSPRTHFWVVLLATGRAYLKILSTYTIPVFRNPLAFLLNFAVWRLTYGIAGRGYVAGAAVSGFLLIGSLGNIIWSSTLWSSGYALERERHEGTSAALFLSPASRSAIVAGYSIGSLVLALPGFALVSIAALITGARFRVADPLALALAVMALLGASLAAAFAFSGLFVLSRRGNLLATFLQVPVYVVAGFVVPIAALPAWLRPISEALPVTHAAIALRQTALLGVTLSGAGPQLLLALAICVIYTIVGWLGLRAVERLAKRAGQLELY
jgi:ABC-2 type transport system permease protein